MLASPSPADDREPAWVMSGISGNYRAKGVPREIVAKLHAEIVRVHNLQEVKDRYATFGLEAASSTPGKFAEVIQADEAKFAKIIKATGAKVE